MVINRVCTMPNKNTFRIRPINQLIFKYINSEKYLWIDPFTNNSQIATITNDTIVTVEQFKGGL